MEKRFSPSFGELEPKKVPPSLEIKAPVTMDPKFELARKNIYNENRDAEGAAEQISSEDLAELLDFTNENVKKPARELLDFNKALSELKYLFLESVDDEKIKESFSEAENFFDEIKDEFPKMDPEKREEVASKIGKFLEKGKKAFSIAALALGIFSLTSILNPEPVRAGGLGSINDAVKGAEAGLKKIKIRNSPGPNYTGNLYSEFNNANLDMTKAGIDYFALAAVNTACSIDQSVQGNREHCQGVAGNYIVKFDDPEKYPHGNINKDIIERMRDNNGVLRESDTPDIVRRERDRERDIERDRANMQERIDQRSTERAIHIRQEKREFYDKIKDADVDWESDQNRKEYSDRFRRQYGDPKIIKVENPKGSTKETRLELWSNDHLEARPGNDEDRLRYVVMVTRDTKTGLTVEVIRAVGDKTKGPNSSIYAETEGLSRKLPTEMIVLYSKDSTGEYRLKITEKFFEPNLPAGATNKQKLIGHLKAQKAYENFMNDAADKIYRETDKAAKGKVEEVEAMFK